jgi:hypothetical protein
MGTTGRRVTLVLPSRDWGQGLGKGAWQANQSFGGLQDTAPHTTRNSVIAHPRTDMHAHTHGLPASLTLSCPTSVTMSLEPTVLLC